MGLDEIRLDGRHQLGVFSGLLFWAFGLDEIKPTVSFSMVFWIFVWRGLSFFLLDHFWVVVVGVLDVGLCFASWGFFFFFFFFSLIVMIFHKPHGGGWVLM